MRHSKLVLFLVVLFTCVVFYTGTKILKPRFKSPRLSVIGFVDMADGLGRQSVELMDALHKEIDVSFLPTRKKNIYNDVPKSIQNIIKKTKRPLGKIVIYEDTFYPTSYIYFSRKFKNSPKDQIRFAYSMLESTAIPVRWAHLLNHFFDAVLVPDPFLVDVYKSSGVSIPIFVLPLGLNLEDFAKKPLKAKKNTPFTFANFGTCILRKNQEDLIEAFYRAFGNKEDVRLWINCKIKEGALYEKLQNKIKKLNVTNILLTNECFSKEEYLKNYEKIDCLVSTSRAEGFSIQPREAMALGIPCIVSDNTAQSTLCKTNLVKAVPSIQREPAFYEFFKDVCGDRFIPDLEKTKEALLDVYTHYDSYLEKSEEMRAFALTSDYQNLHDLYKMLVVPKKLLLGKENSISAECLITDSPTLYKKYENL